MPRKYIYKSNEISLNVVSFIEEDILKDNINLELVTEFKKEVPLIAISHNKFCDNITKCHENLILITNNYKVAGVNCIICNTDNYNEFAIDFIDNITKFVSMINIKKLIKTP